jgi:hypothetical protein
MPFILMPRRVRDFTTYDNPGSSCGNVENENGAGQWKMIGGEWVDLDN